MSGKILIVEDEAKISRLLEIELKSEGYQLTKDYDDNDGDDDQAILHGIAS